MKEFRALWLTRKASHHSLTDRGLGATASGLSNVDFLCAIETHWPSSGNLYGLPGFRATIHGPYGVIVSSTLLRSRNIRVALSLIIVLGVMGLVMTSPSCAIEIPWSSRLSVAFLKHNSKQEKQTKLYQYNFSYLRICQNLSDK